MLFSSPAICSFFRDQATGNAKKTKIRDFATLARTRFAFFKRTGIYT